LTGILLFINGNFGIEIIEVIAKYKRYEITGIVINGENKFDPIYQNLVINNNKVDTLKIPVLRYSPDLVNQLNLYSILDHTSLAVSVLFGHVFPVEMLDNFTFPIFNLHPSLLPVGRGADPVPWSIIENMPQGASIHRIDSGLDTGLIVAQREIYTDLSSTSGEIYATALKHLRFLFEEFLDFWPRVNGEITQVGTSTKHHSNELDLLRKNLLENGAEMESMVRVIQALNFNDGRRARIKSRDGSYWDLEIKVTRVEGPMG
jgi:methionyl-tRNA formyltransferase